MNSTPGPTIKRATSSGIPLNITASPSLPNLPARLICYGYFDEQRRKPVRYNTVVIEEIQTVVQECFRMAEMLFSTEKSLSIAAQILSAFDIPDERIPGAIQHILSFPKLVIFLSKQWSRSTLGFHARPKPMGPKIERDEWTIYLNYWFIERIVAAKRTSDMNATDIHRHLFLAAMGISHELIHLLQRQVWLLLDETTAIDYDTPSKALETGVVVEVEAGWRFEEELLGGRVEGMWVDDDGEADSDTSASSTEGNELSEQREESGVVEALGSINITDDELFPPVLEPKEVEKFSAFDHVVIKRNSKLYDITDNWLRDFYQAYLNSDLSTIPFPPTVDPISLKVQHVARMRFLRHDHASDQDIIRSYEK